MEEQSKKELEQILLEEKAKLEQADNETVKIEDMEITTTYMARYKDHYCRVGVSSNSFIIVDEENQLVVNTKPEKEDTVFDVNMINKLVPNIVITYINETYYSDQQEDNDVEKTEEVNEEKGE